MARTSDKQQKILEYLRTYYAEYSYSPSVREIAEAVGLKSTSSVHYHLAALKESGKIDMNANQKRTISLPEVQRSEQIPILGTVTAGLPILAQENIEGYFPWDGCSGCFALRVRGDSMIGAGILDGDTLVVRQQQTALEGEIVVALLGEEATVKRLHYSADGLWLLPENPAYTPIDARDAQILGLVKAVFRRYS